MIKNLTSYLNKWSPKYYYVSNGTIFEVKGTQDADGCGFQVVDITKTGDALGLDIKAKAPCIEIIFEVDGEEKKYYFPMQQLIEQGDKMKMSGDPATAVGFIQFHPNEFEGDYFLKFTSQLHKEIEDNIKNGMTFDRLWEQLPAWMIIANNTQNLSVKDFIKGIKVVRPEEPVEGVEYGKLKSVKFWRIKNGESSASGAPLNIYTENAIRQIFYSYFLASGINYINKLAWKQMNYKLSSTSEDSIKVATFESTETQPEGFDPSAKITDGELRSNIILNYEPIYARADADYITNSIVRPVDDDGPDDERL